MEFKKKSFGEIVGGILLSTIPLIGFFAVQVIVTIVMMVIYLAKGDPATISSRVLQMATDTGFLMSIIVPTHMVTLAAAIPVYVFAFKERKLANPAKIFSWVSPVAIILLFTGLEMLTSAALACVYNIPFLTKIMEAYSKMLESSGLVEMTPLSTFATVLLAPIAEEIIFRGMTMKLARRFTRKFWIANFIQALLFGIAHGNWVQGTYAFLLGLMLGFIYQKYNSILASVLAHMTFNFAGTYIVSWIYNNASLDDTTALMIEISIGVVATALGLILVMKADAKVPENVQAFRERYTEEWRAMERKKLEEQERLYQLMQQAYMQQMQAQQNTVNAVNTEPAENSESVQSSEINHSENTGSEL